MSKALINYCNKYDVSKSKFYCTSTGLRKESAEIFYKNVVAFSLNNLCCQFY